MNPSISIITPTVRPETLGMTIGCLKRQTFASYEWLVVSPNYLFLYGTYFDGNELLEAQNIVPTATEVHMNLIEEPKKKEGDFYGLNKAFNAGFKKAKGELIVSIVDQTWFSNDTLEILWNNYLANPKACMSAIGHQYEDNGTQEPEVLVWRDPRVRADLGSFYETYPTEMEFCVASFPKQAIIDCGGLDEVFDQYAALSEKEMMARIEKLGYHLYIDQSLAYKAIHHPRLQGKETWDKHYFAGCTYYDICIRAIIAGTRKKLDNFL